MKPTLRKNVSMKCKMGDMKINRRGFFGAAAAAPIAAVSAARDVTEKAESYVGESSLGYGQHPIPIDEATSLRERLQRLRESLANTKPDPRRPDIEEWMVRNVEALRSVSPAYKAHMIGRLQEEMLFARKKFYIQQEIDNLLESAKIMGISIF